MADAAEQVVHQCPRVAEHDQAAENAGDKGMDVGVRRRARGRRNQPPGQEQRAEIKRNTGGAMDDRERHRQGPAIGEEW